MSRKLKEYLKEERNKALHIANSTDTRTQKYLTGGLCFSNRNVRKSHTASCEHTESDSGGPGCGVPESSQVMSVLPGHLE